NQQIKTMFGSELAEKENAFLVHDWRKDVDLIGYVPKEMVCHWMVCPKGGQYCNGRATLTF
ncbi:hypothetical protein ACS4XG_25145, partial [Escherichia coli]|uniref:hypothetical protein n=1 Tax=Escherichia coli TaxID=562 RepID=UPI003F42ACCF